MLTAHLDAQEFEDCMAPLGRSMWRTCTGRGRSEVWEQPVAEALYGSEIIWTSRATLILYTNTISIHQCMPMFPIWDVINLSNLSVIPLHFFNSTVKTVCVQKIKNDKLWLLRGCLCHHAAHQVSGRLTMVYQAFRDQQWLLQHPTTNNGFVGICKVGPPRLITVVCTTGRYHVVTLGIDKAK